MVVYKSGATYDQHPYKYDVLITVAQSFDVYIYMYIYIYRHKGASFMLFNSQHMYNIRFIDSLNFIALIKTNVSSSIAYTHTHSLLKTSNSVISS